MTMLSGSFIIATNSLLTLSFSGYEDLIHKTDESDNPQDLDPLYLGSLDGTKKLQGASNPGVTNLTLTPTDILPKWAVAVVTTLGTCLQPVTPNGYRYQCTTAGTTDAATEPTWPTTIGSTVIDGTVIWTCISLKHLITEVTLALSSGALATNTPGGPLNLGNTILGGVGNVVPIYMRVVNAVGTVSNNTNYPEIGIVLNSVYETAI